MSEVEDLDLTNSLRYWCRMKSCCDLQAGERSSRQVQEEETKLYCFLLLQYPVEKFFERGPPI